MTLIIVAVGILMILQISIVRSHDELSYLGARKNLIELQTYFDQKMKSIKDSVKGTEEEGGCYAPDKSTIMFRALIRKPSKGPISPHAIITFEHIVENEGAAYDIYRGIFTAPLKGIYDFTFSVREAGNKYLELALYKNMQQVGVAVEKQFSSVNLNIALRLDKGDVVYVKNPKTDITSFMGNDESYFTGHLVHELK